MLGTRAAALRVQRVVPWGHLRVDQAVSGVQLLGLGCTGLRGLSGALVLELGGQVNPG